MNKIRDDQNSDPAISFAVQQLEQGGLILRGRFKSQRGMHLRQGLLYRGSKLVVPNSVKREILTMVHNAAHPGVTKTYELIKCQFYWKGMHGDVHDFCEECLVCHRNNRKFSLKDELVPIEDPC